jgi:hypothetical protein
MSPIPFQKSEFRNMLISTFSLTPAATDLEKLLISRSHYPFHAELRRGMKEP